MMCLLPSGRQYTGEFTSTVVSNSNSAAQCKVAEHGPALKSAAGPEKQVNWCDKARTEQMNGSAVKEAGSACMCACA